MKYNENDINYLKKYIKEHNLDDTYFENCLKELAKGKPIQYIIGEVNFYGHDFKVNENVLIPRFETELLIDKTINRIKKLFLNNSVDILDLGTGSGCIAITLKKELNCNVSALDIPKEALEVAKYNAKYNNAKSSFLVQSSPYLYYSSDLLVGSSSLGYGPLDLELKQLSSSVGLALLAERKCEVGRDSSLGR